MLTRRLLYRDGGWRVDLKLPQEHAAYKVPGLTYCAALKRHSTEKKDDI